MLSEPCTVALEIGHGPYESGFEPGALGPEGTTEYSECQRMAEMVAQELRPLGYTVFLIDEPRRLRQLGELAAGADIFVSLHLNAFNRQVQGTEVLVHPKHTKLDRVLAVNIHTHLVRALGLPNRGVKPQPLAVLSGVPTSVEAACLTEPFFLDALGSAAEVRALTAKAAKGIANGIHAYWTEP